MGSTFLDFVRQHGSALEGVRDRAGVAVWHDAFARAWGARARGLAADANLVLRFPAGSPCRIQPDVGYLAVQTAAAPRARRWMLVSLNPGWHATGSAKERSAKGQRLGSEAGGSEEGGAAPDGVDIAAYERFRTRFFPCYPKMVGEGCRWWVSALRFLHDAARLPLPERVDGRLPLHEELDVTGWELWPFHSDKDGLSGLAERDDAPGRALTAFATQSLLAACRVAEVEDRQVVVASAKGRRLLRRLVQDGEAFEETLATTIPRGSHTVPCERYRPRGGGRPVHAVGLQRFAGHVSRVTREAALGFVRG